MPAECVNAANGCTDRYLSPFFLLPLPSFPSVAVLPIYTNVLFRITRGIVNEHLTKCGYTLVECDGYKQFMDSLELPQQSPNPNSNDNKPRSNSNNTSPPHLNSSNNLTSSISEPGNRNSGSLLSSSGNRNSLSPSAMNNRNSLSSDALSLSISPPTSPHVKPQTPTIPEWSENSIKLAKPCGKVPRKDLATHRANQCPYRYAYLLVYSFLFSFIHAIL